MCVFVCDMLTPPSFSHSSSCSSQRCSGGGMEELLASNKHALDALYDTRTEAVAAMKLTSSKQQRSLRSCHGRSGKCVQFMCSSRLDNSGRLIPEDQLQSVKCCAHVNLYKKKKAGGRPLIPHFPETSCIILYAPVRQESQCRSS